MFKRIALAAAVLLALLVIAAVVAMRGSLPRLQGEVALPGLSAPVSIERDALGVATIVAASQADATRALGYLHAQERYFEMDLMRRLAAGELSALFGSRAMDADLRHRRDRMRDRAAAALAASPADLALMQAYADGANAGLASLHTRPWPYLLLRERPAPWRPEDSMLVVYAMYYDLQDEENSQERLLAQVRPHLPPALYALIVHDGTSWDAPMQGTSRGDAILPGPAEVDLRTLARPAGAVRGQVAPPDVGSNNFAVSGDRTADGRAIVADDMHLGLRVPNIWYRARLRYPDPQAAGGTVDVAGFTLPGAPGVVVGSNGHVAWGFTNSYGDWIDWIRLPDCTPARCVGRRILEERIEASDGPATTLRVHESPWGPIEHYQKDGSALARRWVAHLPGSVNSGLFDMARAGSLDEALAVADRTGVPAQNLAVGDRSGRIAWRLIGPMPLRGPGCNPAGISDARTCPPWAISSADAPAIIDPVGGRMWSANARVVDGDFLRRIGDGGYANGVRARMIRDGLMAREQLDERDLLAIQLDDRSVFLRRWWTLLGEQAARPGAGPALKALAAAAPAMETRAAPDAVAYRITRAWWAKVHERVADGLLAPARAALGEDAELPRLRQPEGVVWPLVTQRPAHLLPARYDSWMALFEDAAAEARDELQAKGPLPERTWGERNTAAICHPLAGAVPFARRALCMPEDRLPGDSVTPRTQGPDFGASQRMVVSPGHEADGIIHMPGGQSGHPMSPFWGVGHDDWVDGRPTPFLPGQPVHSLALVPAR